MFGKNSGGGIFGFLLGILNFLSGLFLFYLLFLFIKWYVKGHFGKWWFFFWAWSIFSFCNWQYQKHKMEQEDKEYHSKSAQDIWDERMKDYDPVRGY